MANSPKFFWYELATTDIDAALAFYKAVVGWSSVDHGGAGPRYAVVQVGERGVGGIAAVNPDSPDSRPSWSGYILSRDVDATTQRIAAAGGSVAYGPDDIPDVGRFAVVADPQGAPFKLLAPNGPDQPLVTPGTPGHVGWNELHSTDAKAGFDFYAGQFGWTKDEAFEMGPMGTYQLFAVDGVPSGGMMNSPVAPPAFWLHYFNVADIDAALKLATDRGAELMHGPSEVPGGSFIIQAKDPQGAMFALVGPRP